MRVGSGVLELLAQELAADSPGRRHVIIADDHVHELYGRALSRLLQRHGLDVALLGFPAGEANKNRETKARLEDGLFALGLGRDGVLVAVGGGVTCDLVGFVASTWHRGIPVVQVPTTLLAMADAALGGKTGVNLPGGKNIVGSFHQPWGIYADISTLSTLDDVELGCGFAEVVKSAAIADAGFFRWLEAAVGKLLRREPLLLEQAVVRCVKIKSRVVARDEREHGRRALLNFGHTLGHALEAASAFKLRHGHAVAVGMCLEARLGLDLVGFPPADLRRLESLIEAFGLPARLPDGISNDELIAAAYRDKKTVRGQLHCALPMRLGRMRPGKDVVVPVDAGAVRRLLSERAATG